MTITDITARADYEIGGVMVTNGELARRLAVIRNTAPTSEQRYAAAIAQRHISERNSYYLASDIVRSSASY